MRPPCTGLGLEPDEGGAGFQCIGVAVLTNTASTSRRKVWAATISRHSPTLFLIYPAFSISDAMSLLDSSAPLNRALIAERAKEPSAPPAGQPY